MVGLLVRTTRRFAKDDNGATAVEYGLLSALVSVAAITAMVSLGSSVAGTFDRAADSIAVATIGGTPPGGGGPGGGGPGGGPPGGGPPGGGPPGGGPPGGGPPGGP